MTYISGVGSPWPRSVSDRSLSSEHVDYSSSYDGDDGGATSDIDAYEESYFTPAPNMSKYSHLRPEELETVVPKSVPLAATSTGHLSILLQVILIYHLCPATSLVLIYYAYFAYVGIQPDSLLGATPINMPPLVAASIEVNAISSSTDPGTEPSTKVPLTSESLLIFSFKEAKSRTRDILEKGPPLESAPITTIIITSRGPSSKISELACSLSTAHLNNAKWSDFPYHCDTTSYGASCGSYSNSGTGLNPSCFWWRSPQKKIST